MTLERPALSFERALMKIVDLLGVDRMGEIVDKAPRTIYDYTHPATPTSVSLRDAFALERAYRLAGGLGHPIMEAWAAKLQLAEGGTSADDGLAERTMTVIKESSEAQAALVAALAPGATAIDRANARRELEESISAEMETLAALTDGAGPDGSRERGGNRP